MSQTVRMLEKQDEAPLASYPASVPEQRLIGTLLSQKPHPHSFFVATTMIAFMAVGTLFYWGDPYGWAHLLPASKKMIFEENQWWRIFTSLFIHADLEHFLSNMFMLGIFSFFVYGYFGFYILPVGTILLAAIVNGITVLSYPLEVNLLGASGLVYVLGAFWLTLYFFIQRQYAIFKRLIRVVGIATILFWPTTFVPSTSYRAHALGFCLGLIFGAIYFYKNHKAIRAREIYMSLE